MLTLDPQVAQALVNYLVTRPWGEANGFLLAIKEADDREKQIQGSQQPIPLPRVVQTDEG